MNLEHIQDESCPDCSAPVESETKNARHSCGLWNEVRRFSCGLELRFVPNYGKVLIGGECTGTIAYRMREEKRRIAVLEVHDFIRNLNADEEFKQKLGQWVNYSGYRYSYNT